MHKAQLLMIHLYGIGTAFRSDEWGEWFKPQHCINWEYVWRSISAETLWDFLSRLSTGFIIQDVGSSYRSLATKHYFQEIAGASLNIIWISIMNEFGFAPTFFIWATEAIDWTHVPLLPQHEAELWELETFSRLQCGATALHQRFQHSAFMAGTN